MTALPQWTRAEPPLVPRVVVGQGEVAGRLVDRLLEGNDTFLASLEGVAAGRNLVAIRGPRERLPWVDGVAYFGEAPDTAGLYLPTVRRPNGPMVLWSRALMRRIPAGPVVWFDDGRALSLASARPLARATLEAWRTP